MTANERLAILETCKQATLRGEMPFPEVVRRLLEVGVERYHVDLTRDESTYYLPSGESHVMSLGTARGLIGPEFDAGAVAEAVRSSQRGEIGYPEFVKRIARAGCVGYFAQLAGRQVQYLGRTGDLHVEPFPVSR